MGAQEQKTQMDEKGTEENYAPTLLRAMITLYFMGAFLALFTAQILAEWLQQERRQALASYRKNFQRVENIFPKFKL